MIISAHLLFRFMGIEPHIERFQKEHDDYNKIMLQALADRLAEAFAELSA